MSFSGELSSSGRSFSSLLHSLEGRGRVAVGPGSLPGVSLVKSLISSVDVASAKKPGLPAPERRPTQFRSLTADLQLKAGELRSSGLRIEGANFELRGAGKVSANRKLDGAGRMIFNPGASRFLAQSIPEVRVWLKAPGELEVPFLASGVLPELELEARAPVRATHRDRRVALRCSQLDTFPSTSMLT